jgi:hypothetical protein
LKRLLLFFLLLFSIATIAQTPDAKKDSTKMYKDIEKYSKKSGFGKFIYRLVFRSTRKAKASKNDLLKQERLKKMYASNENKIIRNIYIETLDPFGYSVDNPDDKPTKDFERFGNRAHLKTKNWTIKNILLIKEGQPLDSLKSKESERLIRSQRYVRRALIQPITIKGSKDSVDISVRVLDSWTLTPNGSISGSSVNFELTERNFLGLGHEVENEYGTRFKTGEKSQYSRYRINNIRNTFINATALYNNDLRSNVTRSITFERPFFSTFTRWAAGINYQSAFRTDSLPNNQNIYGIQTYRTRIKDFWVGHSFKIFSGKSEIQQTTKLVTAISYKDLSFVTKPDLAYDPQGFFTSEKLYLSSIGISSQKFFQDKFLFNYGIIEDVPYGYLFSVTGGFQNKNYKNRSYIGGNFSYGSYFNFGYLAAKIEYGSFLNSGKNEESTFRVDINYFTNILNFGRWRMRQFIKPSVVIGTNRNSSVRDRMFLEGQNGIPGFNSDQRLFGTKRLLTSFQTQTYAPGSWYGFRFSPFVNFTFGSLGNEETNTFSAKIYSQFSLGVLVNNDYLVFNSFQLSFTFYPTTPLDGTNFLRTNALQNDDFKINNYFLGEPKIVPYQ